jgi:hypothetical protein
VRLWTQRWSRIRWVLSLMVSGIPFGDNILGSKTRYRKSPPQLHTVPPGASVCQSYQSTPDPRAGSASTPSVQELCAPILLTQRDGTVSHRADSSKSHTLITKGMLISEVKPAIGNLHRNSIQFLQGQVSARTPSVQELCAPILLTQRDGTVSHRADSSKWKRSPGSVLVSVV